MYGGFLAAMAAASVLPQFRSVFRGTSEPLGLLIGGHHDVRRRGPRRPPGRVAPGQAGRPGLLRQPPVDPRGHAAVLPGPLRRVRRALARPLPAADRDLGGAHGQRREPHRRARRAGRRRGRHRRAWPSSSTPCGCPTPVCWPGRTWRRWWPSSPSASASGSCPTTPTRPGSSWATPERCSSGCCWRASTILVGGRTADQFSGQTFFFFAPLVIPFVILGVPMLDIALAVVRRAARRTSIAMPDKEHLHHRLMRLGHGQRRAVFILWAWTAVLAGFVLAPTYTNEGNALVPFGIAALALVLYAIFHPTAREARRAAIEAEPAVDERRRGTSDELELDPRRRRDPRAAETHDDGRSRKSPGPRGGLLRGQLDPRFGPGAPVEELGRTPRRSSGAAGRPASPRAPGWASPASTSPSATARSTRIVTLSSPTLRNPPLTA